MHPGMPAMLIFALRSVLGLGGSFHPSQPNEL